MTDYDLFRQEVREYSKLHVGWDTYNAPPPSDNIIQYVLEFIDALEEGNIIINSIMPTVENSIIVEYTNDERSNEWEFWSDGDISILQKFNEEKIFFDITFPE